MGNRVPVRRGRKNTVQETPAEPAVQIPESVDIQAVPEPEKVPEPEQMPEPEQTPEREPVSLRGTEELLLPEEVANADTVPSVPQDTMRIPAYLLEEDVVEKHRVRDREVRRAGREQGRKLTKEEKRRLRDEEAWKQQALEEAREREELEERQRRVEEEQRRIREEARERMENLDAAEKRLIERESRFELEVERRAREIGREIEPKVVVSPKFKRAKTATVIWIVVVFLALAMCSILLGIRNDRLRNELKNAETANAQITQGPSAQEAPAGAQAEGAGIQTVSDGTRRVYLTFDDGPSEVTVQILDLLKAEDIKATFFVVGREDEASGEIYKRIVEEGHTLAMHSFTHDYSELYESLDNFQADLHRLQNHLYKVTGYWCTIYRFPGGSSNSAAKEDMGELAAYLEREHITYYDWNVYGGDDIPPETIVSNIKANVEKYDEAIILLHDAADKEETVEALPEVISHIRGLGNTVFLPITKDTTPVQHGDTP